MKCYTKINKLQPEVGYYVMRPKTFNLQYSKFSSLKPSIKSSTYFTQNLHLEITSQIVF
jgi:hypothetical protein